MHFVCSGCMPYNIGVYQCGLWSIVQVSLRGFGGLCSPGCGKVV